MLYIKKYLSNQTITMDSFISPFMQSHYCNHRTSQGGKIMDNHTDVKWTQNERFIIIAKLSFY